LRRTPKCGTDNARKCPNANSPSHVTIITIITIIIIIVLFLVLVLILILVVAWPSSLVLYLTVTAPPEVILPLKR